MDLKLAVIGSAIALTVSAGGAVWDAKSNTLTLNDGSAPPGPTPGTGPGSIPTRWWNGDGKGAQNLLQWTFDNNYPFFTTIDGSKSGYGTQGPSTDFRSDVEAGYVVMTGTGVIPAAGPGPGPGPTPPGPGTDPTIPSDTPIGADTIPCPNGQTKTPTYSSPMVLQLVNQPAGKSGQLGLIRTAPAIGGDMDAGPASVQWIDADTGQTMSRDFDAPVTIYYATDQKVDGAFFNAEVGSAIQVTVPKPIKNWFGDYRTPNF